jgi:hypothetical protein
MLYECGKNTPCPEQGINDAICEQCSFWRPKKDCFSCEYMDHYAKVRATTSEEKANIYICTVLQPDTTEDDQIAWLPEVNGFDPFNCQAYKERK